MTAPPWQQAFLATSVAIGESMEQALEALPPESAGLFESLRTGGREARAQVLARHLALVAVDLERLEPSWRG